MRRSRADATTLTPFQVDGNTWGYETNVKTGRPIHKPSQDASGHAEYYAAGKLVTVHSRKSS